MPDPKRVDRPGGHKVDRFILDYRFRFQVRDQLGITKAEGDYPSFKYRLRLKAKYNINNWKLDPYFSFEAFISQETNTINYIPTITETEKKLWKDEYIADLEVLLRLLDGIHFGKTETYKSKITLMAMPMIC